jgi:hypothetical protein
MLSVEEIQRGNMDTNIVTRPVCESNQIWRSGQSFRRQAPEMAWQTHLAQPAESCTLQ